MRRPARNRLATVVVALVAATAMGSASAQSYYDQYRDRHYDGYARDGYGQPYPDRYGNSGGAVYDYARVLRVDPVIDSRYGYGDSRYGYGGYPASGQNCTYREANTYAGSDPYYSRSYGSDPYAGGSQAGATVATVIGGIVGAAIGSQVGGGSARYATSALGTMVGGMAGRQIYEQNRRDRYRSGTVRVCDPVPTGGYGSYPTGDGRVAGYDVTYEYAGRTFRTRTDYHPGDRIRVRVDVRPD
ncbi:glycine zipper 2TM domain-containing protein [Luteimonas pelagia]